MDEVLDFLKNEIEWNIAYFEQIENLKTDEIDWEVYQFNLGKTIVCEQILAMLEEHNLTTPRIVVE